MSTETLGTTSQLQITIPRARTRDWAVSIRNNCFQKIVEHDHTGVSGKGIQLSTAAISADAITGAKIRLDNNEYLKGRNAADSANKDIVKVSASDELVFGTTIATADFQDDGLTISDNADNTKKIALNAGNITTGTTRTLSAPDATGTLVLNDNAATLSYKSIDADANTITNIKNADIKAAAAIAVDKLAATTASRALVSDGSGFISAATTTATEIGYVNGVTSAIQTQINAKAPSASPTFSGTITTPLTASRALVTGASSELAVSSTTATEIGYVNGVTSAIQTQLNAKLPTTITTTGDIIYSSSGTTASRLAIGSAGQVLTVSGGLPAWGTNTVAPTAPVSKTTTYTATTNDETILCSTSGGSWTLTLYTAVGNSGRKLKIKKTTSDTGILTIDGDGSETIDGSTTYKIADQYECIEIQSDGSNWYVVAKDIGLGAMIRVHTGRDFGGSSSGDTKIRNFLTLISSTGGSITRTERTTTTGEFYTVNVTGKYSVSYTDYHTAAPVTFGLSLNTTQTSTSIQSLTTVAERIGVVWNADVNTSEFLSTCLHLSAGDIIRAHTEGNGNNSDRVSFTITRVG